MTDQNLSTRTNAGAAVVAIPGTSDGLVSKNGVPGNQTGAAIIDPYVGQVVQCGGLTTNVTLNTSATDISGSTLSIPSAGIWQLFYSLTVEVTVSSGNQTYAAVYITDTANTLVTGTPRILMATNGESITSLAANTVVITTGAKTYKMRGARVDNTGTGTASVIYSATNYENSFYAVRIA